jgi:hypothetical protein
VQKEVVEGARGTNIAIYFVWMPMVPSDDGPDAFSIASELRDERTKHFFDPRRLVGIQLERDHFEDFAKQTQTTAPPEFQKRIAERLQKPAEKRPVWDAVLVWHAGAQWRDTSPKPQWAARQIGFFGTSEAGEPTGVIWKLGAAQPENTGWFIELRALRKLLIVQAP